MRSSLKSKQPLIIPLCGKNLNLTIWVNVAKVLSVGKKRVADWLSRIVKDEKVKRNSKIFELWLACHTQDEIAEVVKVTKETVSEITSSCQKKFLETESDKSMMFHAADFDIPIYNI